MLFLNNSITKYLDQRLFQFEKNDAVMIHIGTLGKLHVIIYCQAQALHMAVVLVKFRSKLGQIQSQLKPDNQKPELNHVYY